MRVVSGFVWLQVGGSLALAIGGLAGVAQGDAKGWWIFGFFTLCAMIISAAPRLRMLRERAVAKAPRLVIDAAGVRRDLGEQVEAVRWDALAEVWIVTTADGPFAEDVFFVLRGAGETGVVVPQGLAVEHNLLGELQARLPDLNNEAIIRAMGCADDARFVIWPPEKA
jgi:hypothetical protein